MKADNSRDIVGRFFTALALLKSDGVINGVATFTKAHGIDRRNLYAVQHGKKSCFELAWLEWLVEDYNINAHWLLTGRGSVYKKRASE